MVTLEQLCERLGNNLRPAVTGPIGRQQLTGVHISELADPTPYLEGGELLLTTGIPLRGGPVVIRDYVHRLAHKGVAALALGLGAGTDRVDPQLVSACADASLDLLLVPEAVPFLHISRGFWQLVGKSEQADLASRLGLQTALARAATRDNAVESIVTVLAKGLGGWAAYLPADGTAETIWPSTAAEVVPQLRAESTRFDLVGTYSAATFPVNGTDVVEHSITVGPRTVGFLAVGAGRGLQKADRQLIITACMLLSVTAQRAQEASRVAVVVGGTIAALILGGHADAARLAAEHAGLPAIGGVVRILAVRRAGPGVLDSPELERIVGSLGLPESTLSATVGGVAIFILGETAAVNADTGVVAAGHAVALSRPMPLVTVPAAVSAVVLACRTAALSAVVVVDGSADIRGETWVDALAHHPRGDLRNTVRSYLAHRGHWETTARELDIHRNSLRQRIAVATELLGVDLTDPDIAATLWIALRSSLLHPKRVDQDRVS
ncbi:PucR family transcriptional regulator [Frigoribacterium sp. CG_9.8]|uniref:helix-turn-helix domain-containing protein n=1 Tax=Frigoribacterium sp. CG_9.8 TaxID=2787733 RepID=UPI0018C93BE9|nr:PucR family transcriptional regulator [Frigoribacterium sp. CG_9.8]MBG6108711.1 purine catabolism regulator [Frigoribacterium sp. CG_9.8]